jgi:hypothetical protein
LHVSEDSLALLKELIEIGFHLTLLYHCRYNTQGQNPPACLLFDFGLLYGHTPRILGPIAAADAGSS